MVAIVTKFDVFVQDMQQEIEAAADEEGEEIDDEELEKQALDMAMAKFEQHYKSPLNMLPFPPKAVVTLSEGNRSRNHLARPKTY